MLTAEIDRMNLFEIAAFDANGQPMRERLN